MSKWANHQWQGGQLAKLKAQQLIIKYLIQKIASSVFDQGFTNAPKIIFVSIIVKSWSFFALPSRVGWRKWARELITNDKPRCMVVVKGQLISKCIFGVFNFFQKMNENKSTWAQCQIELLFFPLHYFHSFRAGLGVKKSNFFFYK